MGIRGTRALAALVLSAVVVAGCAVQQPGSTPAAAPGTTASGPAAATTAAPTPSAPDTGPRTVTVALTGDQLWHLSLMKSLRADAAAAGSSARYEYGPLFASVRPILTEADAAICHVEVPVVRRGQQVTGYPAFGADPSTVAGGITANGFDLCTTASNHSLDRGFDGLTNTLDRLDAAGVVAAGTSRTQEESRRPRIFTTAGGVKIGLVTGTYDMNGGRGRAGQRPWAVDWLDADALLARAKATRAAGADIVIVNLHAGTEYVTAPSSQQRALAQRLAASDDVDLIYGHHAHTVQPIAKVGDTWVAYGVGNLVGQMRHSTPRAMEAIIVRATFTEEADGSWRVSRMGYVPLLITWHSEADGPARLYAINQALAAGVGPTKRLRASKQFIRKAVGTATGLEED